MPTMIVDGTEVEMPAALVAAMPTAAALAVPAAVTNFQGRAALRAAGLFDAADAAVAGKAAALDTAGFTNDAATLREAWNKAQFMRTSPLLAELGALLGITAKQMDDLFIAAASTEL